MPAKCRLVSKDIIIGTAKKKSGTHIGTVDQSEETLAEKRVNSGRLRAHPAHSTAQHLHSFSLDNTKDHI